MKIVIETYGDKVWIARATDVAACQSMRSARLVTKQEAESKYGCRV